MQVVVHYHELALKGGNRPFFVEKLAGNLRQATSDLGGSVQILAGRLLVRLPDDLGWPVARERIGSVMGVANFGRVESVAPEMNALKAAATASIAAHLAARPARPASFRVLSKRSHKQFARTSIEIDRELG